MKNLIKALEKKLEHLFERKEVPKYLSGKGKNKIKNSDVVLDHKQHSI